MKAEVGEQIVGAYLKVCERCQFVAYNVRPRGGGLEGLSELDVVGLDPATKRAFVCEVTTHITGLQIGSSRASTVDVIRKKHARQQQYAKNELRSFDDIRFSFWSPVVPVGKLTDGLKSINGLELVVNAEYAKRVRALQQAASTLTHDLGNDAFRLMQILARIRE